MPHWLSAESSWQRLCSTHARPRQDAAPPAPATLMRAARGCSKPPSVQRSSLPSSHPHAVRHRTAGRCATRRTRGRSPCSDWALRARPVSRPPWRRQLPGSRVLPRAIDRALPRSPGWSRCLFRAGCGGTGSGSGRAPTPRSGATGRPDSRYVCSPRDVERAGRDHPCPIPRRGGTRCPANYRRHGPRSRKGVRSTPESVHCISHRLSRGWSRASRR